MISRSAANAAGHPPPARSSIGKPARRRALRRCAGNGGHKIAATVQRARLSRFDLKSSSGTLPHDDTNAQHRALGTKVAPRVRELLDAPIGD